MKKQFFSFFCIILIFLLLFSGCGVHESSPAETTLQPAADGAFSLGNDIYIAEMFPYTGPYVKDGSDEACADVAAVRLENRSSQHYEYLTFSVETAGGVYDFSVSTLFAGACVTVLAQNKQEFRDEPILSAEIGALAEFMRQPSIHMETLSVSYTDGFINVKNIGEASLSNVYVYYKTLNETGYLGGITYRAAIGDLAAGAVAQMPAPHMKKEDSWIVFAAYDD